MRTPRIFTIATLVGTFLTTVQARAVDLSAAGNAGTATQNGVGGQVLVLDLQAQGMHTDSAPPFYRNVTEERNDRIRYVDAAAQVMMNVEGKVPVFTADLGYLTGERQVLTDKPNGTTSTGFSQNQRSSSIDVKLIRNEALKLNWAANSLAFVGTSIYSDANFREVQKVVLGVEHGVAAMGDEAFDRFFPKSDIDKYNGWNMVVLKVGESMARCRPLKNSAKNFICFNYDYLFKAGSHLAASASVGASFTRQLGQNILTENDTFFVTRASVYGDAIAKTVPLEQLRGAGGIMFTVGIGSDRLSPASWVR